MNFMQKLLRRLFPRDGQLRIAVYDDGHAQLQEYCGYSGNWKPHHPIYYNSFDEAKQAYDALMEDRNRLDKMHSIVRTYP